MKTTLLFLLIAACLCVPRVRRSARRVRDEAEAAALHIASQAGHYVEHRVEEVCAYLTAPFVDGKPGEGAEVCWI